MTETEESGQNGRPMNVFLVDDHGIVRTGMRAYLGMLEDIEVVGEAADGQQALDILHGMEIDRKLPDVVMMDLVMPRMDGITATAAIRGRYPRVEVVALTSFIEEDKVHAALDAGAAGYLLKDADADEVAAAIRSAHQGEMHLDPAVAKRLMHSLRSPKTTDLVEPLTDREREILILSQAARPTKRSPVS
jgi:DNA-binding NarL/FixJ family response regulator